MKKSKTKSKRGAKPLTGKALRSSHEYMVKNDLITHASTKKSPVRLTWEICEKNSHLRRKELIDLCMTKGIAYYTARTQYQEWNAARKRDAANAANSGARLDRLKQVFKTIPVAV